MRFDLQVVEEARIREGDFASSPGDRFGAFKFMGPCGMDLVVLADDGQDTRWEHVSVSGRRIPNWSEMCFIKDLFWDPEACVVQYHPPMSRHVNNMPTCLHLWRHRDVGFPQPPDDLVGIREFGVLA